ncbi:MAG: glyoxalase [Alphaproteobacteria bacterium]|nr:MAG: glyoxalase [Alphaproteobacteria bacterium]
MLGYVMVGTNDIEKAGKFYDTLLAELGAKRNIEADSFISWSSGDETTSFCVIKPNDGNPATVGNGVMMALYAPDHATVDKIYALALEMGGTCEGPAGSRPEFSPDFYAGYFRDLDGNKLNVFNFKMP